jgi:hypothetical protein
MQLGFDRQHFTLPRVGIFLGLNKGLPVERQWRFDKSWASVDFLFEFVVKGLVTDQFHLVRIVEAPTPGSRMKPPGLSTPVPAQTPFGGEQRRGISVGAIVDM